MLQYTNRDNAKGTVQEVLRGADVFIGVSQGNLLTSENIRSMAANPIVFAMANPHPEILPEAAYAGGAAVVGTGRSDFPNQVNNVLAFPGIFRGALNAGARQITPRMKLAAAYALAAAVPTPTREMVIPRSLDKSVAWIVAEAVHHAAKG